MSPLPTLQAPITASEGRIEFSDTVTGRANPASVSTLTKGEALPTPQKTSISGERYFNQNNEITPQASDASRLSVSSEAHNQISAHVFTRHDVPSVSTDDLKARKQPVSRQLGMYSAAENIVKELPGNSGICMPSPPCKVGEYCGMGHVCTFNYNLGYPTCQYNLEIGSTLCYDKDGQLNLQPSS